MKRLFKNSVIVILLLGTAIYLPSCMKEEESLPVVTTTVATIDVSEIFELAAVMEGSVTSNGSVEITSRGVCWNTSANPTIENDKTIDGTGLGRFTSNLSVLTPGTTYFVRAYAVIRHAINNEVLYGNELSFTTYSYVTTSEIVSSSRTWAVVTGNIYYGQIGIHLIGSGVCWSTSQNPTTADSIAPNETYSGIFTTNLTGLTQGTTYYVRAYALYDNGPTIYGNELSFTTQATGDLPGKIGSFSAASFSIGTKLYLGLGVKDFWEWDQTTNVWTRKADYPGNSSGVAVSFSIGTKGYIGFGNDIIDGLTNEFWEYDPSTNSWTQKASLPKSRGMAVGFSIGTKGYIGTGYKDSYTDYNYPGLTYQDFWEWDQQTNTWTQKATFGGIARFGAIGFSIGNKGYIGIGSDGGNNPLNDFWEWDQAKDIWTKKADFVGISRLRAVGFSIGNKGYVGTGTDDGTTLFKDFWEWDQASDTWLKKEDFGGNARGGAVGFSIGNKGYIGTGGTGSTYLDSTFQDFWEWDQAIDTWTKKTDIPGVGR